MGRRIELALLVTLALSAVHAGSAAAAATTTAAKVYTGASPGTELTTSESIVASIGSGTTVVLKSKVGTSATPIELTATGASCSGCKLENKEVTSKAGKVAFGTGKILFTGVTVNTPAHCAVSSEAGVEKQVITKTLNGHGDFMNGTTAVVQSLPAVGTSVAAFELENGGGTCAVAGLYSVNGTAFCDWPEPTGITGLKHGCSFSPTVQSNDGGALTVGSRAAEVTGTGVGSLTSEKEWTIK